MNPLRIQQPLTLNVLPPPIISLSLAPRPFNLSLLPKSHLSTRLWLPSSFNISPSPLSPIGSDNIVHNSWVSVNKFSSLSPSTSAVIDPSIPSPIPSIRVKKIQFKPSSILYGKLKQAFEVTHTLYNYCKFLIDQGQPAILSALRPLLLNNTNTNIFPPDVKEYFAQVPYDVRDEAIRDFIKAYKIQLQLVKEGKKDRFEMHYRSKKDIFEKSIVINHKHITQSTEGLKFFSRTWSNEPINLLEEVPLIRHDCRLTMTKDNRFYIIIPIDIDETNHPKRRRNNIAALDPGVKIFQTVYDSENTAYLIGSAGVYDDNDINGLDKISRIAQRMRRGRKKVNENGTTRFRDANNKKEKKALKKQAENLERKNKEQNQ